MKKAFSILIITLMLSTTSAWAIGLNSFTLAGTVTSVHCIEFEEAPTLSCLVNLDAPDGNSTQVICSDPMTAGACRWLEEGDPVLIVGVEKTGAKQATHVALMLHDIPHDPDAAKSKAAEDQRQRLQDLKDAVAELEDSPES